MGLVGLVEGDRVDVVAPLLHAERDGPMAGVEQVARVEEVD